MGDCADADNAWSATAPLTSARDNQCVEFRSAMRGVAGGKQIREYRAIRFTLQARWNVLPLFCRQHALGIHADDHVTNGPLHVAEPMWHAAGDDHDIARRDTSTLATVNR